MTPADNTPVQADALAERLRERDRDWQKHCDRWVAEIAEKAPGELPPESEAVMRDTLYRQAADLIERLAHQPTTDAEAVVRIGKDYALQWASPDTLTDIARRTGIKVGSKLYAHPPADKVRIAALEAALQRIADGKWAMNECRGIARAALENRNG